MELMLLAALYFLPTVIASWRGSIKTGGVFVVNLFLGWSLIGWVIALAWGVSSETWKQRDRDMRGR